MTFAVIVCTVTLAAIFVAWYLDRVATFGGSDHEGELERRIEEQSAQIAQLVRALESRPERRPAVTRTRPEPPEPPAAAPVPVPVPESKPDPKPAEHREEPEPATLPKNRSRRAELHQAAKELHAMGMTYTAIGEALGVSRQSALRYVTDRDWKGRPFNAPKSESERGQQAELDLAPKKKRSRPNYQIQITKKTRPELVENAKMLRELGLTHARIAEVLKISPTTVGRYLAGDYPGAPADRHQGGEGES